MKSSKFQHKILVIYYLLIVKIESSHKNATKIDSNEKGSHLKYGYVKRVCSNRVQICKSNHTVVCTMRLFGGKAEYKDFENSCFLFLNNMCNDFDREYNILTSGTCEEYFKSRRQNNPTQNDKTTTMAAMFPITKKAARMETYNYSARYEVNTAPDEHLCPLSCPPIYEPVCVNVNTGYGLYFKMYTFVNHCAGDLYYCQHWEEFQPPPGGDEEKVQTSLLSMRACAQNRFIQFARFTEMASAIGHYGWLAGDYRIQAAQDRSPWKSLEETFVQQYLLRFMRYSPMTDVLTSFRYGTVNYMKS